MKSISNTTKNEIAEHTEIKEVRKGWDEAFKKAILNGEILENDMFEGMKNEFDDSEWHWKQQFNKRNAARSNFNN